jgi:hypothetical protein
MSRQLIPLSLVALVLASCRYQPASVPVRGAASDIAALAGTWEGEYSSDESRRGGSITFTIRAGSDTAFGDVAMIPGVGAPLVAADAASHVHLQHVGAPDLLRVTFVSVSGGLVEGALEPYVAPDCKCVVTTVFRGALTDGRLTGDYVTQGENGLRQRGRWSLRRRGSGG